jgi:hypothetical protein
MMSRPKLTPPAKAGSAVIVVGIVSPTALMERRSAERLADSTAHSTFVLLECIYAGQMGGPDWDRTSTFRV